MTTQKSQSETKLTQLNQPILINFHIGRGGKFNNPGHTDFVGVGRQIYDSIETSLIEGENKNELYTQGGSCAGSKISTEKGYDINEDGEYNSHYGYWISSINEIQDNDLDYILESEIGYQLFQEFGIDIEKRFECLDGGGTILDTARTLTEGRRLAEDCADDYEYEIMEIHDSLFDEDFSA